MLASFAEAKRTATRLHINVADTGPGIREDQLNLLFVPFERLDAGRTDVEGTGIGLALSRRLAEAMGGGLDVESTVGVGTTFIVELPAAAKSAAAVEAGSGVSTP